MICPARKLLRSYQFSIKKGRSGISLCRKEEYLFAAFSIFSIIQLRNFTKRFRVDVVTKFNSAVLFDAASIDQAAINQWLLDIEFRSDLTCEQVSLVQSCRTA